MTCCCGVKIDKAALRELAADAYAQVQFERIENAKALLADHAKLLAEYRRASWLRKLFMRKPAEHPRDEGKGDVFYISEWQERVVDHGGFALRLANQCLDASEHGGVVLSLRDLSCLTSWATAWRKPKGATDG